MITDLNSRLRSFLSLSSGSDLIVVLIVLWILVAIGRKAVQHDRRIHTIGIQCGIIAAIYAIIITAAGNVSSITMGVPYVLRGAIFGVLCMAVAWITLSVLTSPLCRAPATFVCWLFGTPGRWLEERRRSIDRDRWREKSVREEEINRLIRERASREAIERQNKERAEKHMKERPVQFAEMRRQLIDLFVSHFRFLKHSKTWSLSKIQDFFDCYEKDGKFLFAWDIFESGFRARQHDIQAEIEMLRVQLFYRKINPVLKEIISEKDFEVLLNDVATQSRSRILTLEQTRNGFSKIHEILHRVCDDALPEYQANQEKERLDKLWQTLCDDEEAQEEIPEQSESIPTLAIIREDDERTELPKRIIQ